MGLFCLFVTTCPYQNEALQKQASLLLLFTGLSQGIIMVCGIQKYVLGMKQGASGWDILNV